MKLLRIVSALTFAASLIAMPAVSQAAWVGYVDIPPPAIPTYVMPPAPFVNAMWTPGYWAWGSAGYYWVPGTWVAAPQVGFLWTPGYWGWGGTGYMWHAGYWGPHVGFYGGINYGFGYWGNGFYGGVWHGGSFSYNTAVVNVNRTVIHNTYDDKTVVNKYGNNNHTSYNGGKGGTTAKESQQQKQDRDDSKNHQMTPDQQKHEDASSHDSDQYANKNHGQPAHPSTEHPYSQPRTGSRPPSQADMHMAAPHMMGGRGRPPAS